MTCRCECHEHEHHEHEHHEHEHDHYEHEHDHCEHEHHERERHHRHHDHECCGCGCGCGGGPGGGRPGGVGGRPGHTTGTSRGRLPTDGGMTVGDLQGDHPPNSWAGQRKDLYLPYLFLRANAGDTGARPVVGPFWESPDIMILSGVEPSAAPPVPPQLGQTAQAGAPNTVYAHVWNFGQSAAPQTVVEFYWCDPSLGIGSQSAHLIGQTVISLGARGSGMAHAVVKCPEAWTPTFLNGGHECLVVRVWDYTSDALGTPPWDASLNRHVGQRNIHVVAAGPAAMELAAGSAAGAVNPLLLPPPPPLPLPVPVLLKVGPLYGAPAQVAVERVVPASMPWLQLHTGVRGQFPAQAMPTGTVELSRPVSTGGGVPTGGAATSQAVTGDDQQVVFTTTDKPPGPGEAHVYRVSAAQDGQLVGGYTVVLLGS